MSLCLVPFVHPFFFFEGGLFWRVFWEVLGRVLGGLGGGLGEVSGGEKTTSNQ